jgi:uncharacterized membrane protein
MLDTISGLPLHPLIVHAVVVLVPLAAVGAILMAIWPKFSRRFGVLVVLVAVGAAVASWFARATGQQLDEIFEAGQKHMDLGAQMPFIATLFAAVTLIFWLFDRRIPSDGARPLWLMVFAAVVIVIAISAFYFVILTGDSGAQAVWSDR